MKNSKKDAEWKVALVYVLIFVFSLSILALFMSITPPISKITHLFATFLSSSILIELLFLWGIIFGATKFINRRYFIKNKLRVIRFSTVYLIIVAILASTFPVFWIVAVSLRRGLAEVFSNVGTFLAPVVILIVAFYLGSKRYIKEDSKRKDK